MKRLLVVLLIALFCFSLLLVGCASKKEEAQEEVQTEETMTKEATEDVQTEQAEETPAEESGH